MADVFRGTWTQQLAVSLAARRTDTRGRTVSGGRKTNKQTYKWWGELRVWTHTSSSGGISALLSLSEAFSLCGAWSGWGLIRVLQGCCSGSNRRRGIFLSALKFDSRSIQSYFLNIYICFSERDSSEYQKVVFSVCSGREWRRAHLQQSACSDAKRFLWLLIR